MSCSVCRLPFVPSPRSVFPIRDHFPPDGLMNKAAYAYFTKSTGIGNIGPDKTMWNVVADYDYVSKNLFVVFGQIGLGVSFEWERDGDGTVWMMHQGCAKIFFRVFGRENLDPDDVVELCQVKEVLGPNLLDGEDHGKFPGVQYEAIGERIDLRPYWSRKPHVAFDFNALTADKKQWLLTRPDVFPRFPKVVDHAKRVQHLLLNSSAPGPGSDILTKQPFDIVQALILYLPAQSFVNVMSTCKYLRYHALTTFQPHVRSLLIDDFPWAFPTDLEYEAVHEKKVRDALVSTDLKECGPEADWMLYLTRVHSSKSNSMRARRYIWSVCDEIKRVYEEKLPGSAFAPEVTPEGVERATVAREDLEEIVSKFYFGKQTMCCRCDEC